MTTPFFHDVKAFTDRMGKMGITGDSSIEHLGKIETAILDVVHVCTLNTWQQVATFAVATISKYSNGAFTQMVLGFMAGYELTMEDIRRQQEAGTPADEMQAGDWLREGFGSVVSNYRSIKNSELLKRFRVVASLLVAGGFVGDDESLGRRVLATVVDTSREAKWDAWDFGEEVMYLIKGVWDVINDCVIQQSWSPLLGSSATVTEIETERAFLRGNLDWYMVGSLTRVTEGERVVTPAEFVARVEAQVKRVRAYHRSCRQAAERTIVARYLVEAEQMKAAVNERISRSSTRVEPFCIKLDGTTATGKSATMGKLLRDILRQAGAPYSDEHLAVIDTGSKYMDTVTNITQGVLMDDVANTLPQCSNLDEGLHIVRLKNTIKTPVAKAAVEEKGGTFLDVKALVVSTNAPYLNAFMTSCEPSSILRRFAFHIIVEVAPGFEKDNGPGTLRMLDAAKLTEGIHTRCQVFTVREWVPHERTGTGRDTGEFRVVAEGLNYSGLAEFLAPHVRAHFARQERMVAELNALAQLPLCEHNFTTEPDCDKCKARELEVEAGDVLRRVRAAGAAAYAAAFQAAQDDPAFPPQRYRPSLLRMPDTPPAAYAAYSFWPTVDMAERWRTAAVCAVRMCFYRTSLEHAFIFHPVWFMVGAFGAVPVVGTLLTYLCLWLVRLPPPVWGWPVVLMLWVWLVSAVAVRKVRETVARHTLAELKKIVGRMTARRIGTTLAAVLGMATMALMVRGYLSKRRSTRLYDLEGASMSRATAEPDPVPRPDVWARRELRVFGHAEGSNVETMTTDQILDRVSRQHFIVRFHYASGNVVDTHALMVCTNVALLPAHNFIRSDGTYSEIVKLAFRRTPASTGAVFEAKVGAVSLVRLAGDMMLVQINKCATMVDLTPHFTNDAADRFPAMELRRDFDTCEQLRTTYFARCEEVECDAYGWKYPGLLYTRDEPTYVGLCGALILSNQRFPVIVGLHTMGRGCNGAACIVRRDDVERGLAELRERALVRVDVVQQLHTSVYTPPGLEAKGALTELCDGSVLREAPEGAAFVPLGTLANYQQIRSKSQLEVSPISDIVAAKCGEPRIHGPPENIGKKRVEVEKVKEFLGLAQLPPDIMRLAQQDMSDEMECAIIAGDLGQYLKPLSEVDACSGIPGSHAVRRVNTSTAAGFPYTGPKHHLLAGCPTEERPAAIQLTDSVREELEAAEEVLARRERLNFVFKGSHKDEATKVTKKKVRIFEGVPFLLTYLFRVYYLPIMRVYMLAQLQLGCAVGIDATGIEWDAMFRHLSAYNSECVLEGDWVHYDTSLDYQETMSVFTVWLEVAKRHGTYTPRDIAIMTTLAEEVCRHYMMLKGDICIVDGWNPSGNSVTTFLNNACNAQRARAAFYALAPEVLPPPLAKADTVMDLSGVSYGQEKRNSLVPLRSGLGGRFADYVREMYYGDDFLLVAKPAVTSWYNQRTISAWFATEGKAMTAANKGEFQSDTTPWANASFLKRSFRPDEDLGAVVAPLALDSIYKSLHVWPKKLAWAPPVHCGVLIAGAIRELLLHGRVEYEERVPRLLEIADAFGSRQYVEGDVTYEAAKANWIERAQA